MVTMRRLSVFLFGCLLFLTSGCGSGDPQSVHPLSVCESANPVNASLVQIANCSGTPAVSLPNYDRVSEQFLDEDTRHPTDNLGGSVVWGTRYYLESLITAYEATGNPKYIEAFLDSGQWVLNLVKTTTVVDAPDPGQPVAPGSAPLLTVTGWPTRLGMFSVPAMVPTQTGQAALYAQSLGGAASFEVTQQSNGALQLAWTAGGQILQTSTIQSVSDLNALASGPLVWGQSVGRIKPTGAGLPAPGVYPVNLQETTMWNSEQAGGILLPFAHFLLLVNENPALISEATREEWTSRVLAIAAGYENVFISDGHGGLRQHNPVWLPNTSADLDAAMDYISVEATLRLFLYKLTGDPHQLAIASGLILHQQNFHLLVGPQGWLLLQFWPDIVPWSSRSNAPSGNVWDSFEYPLNVASPVSDGGFFVDLLHYLKALNIELCVPDYLYSTNQMTFQQYLLYGFGASSGGSTPLRGAYPIQNSTVADAVNPSQDPFAGSGFLTSEVANQPNIDANWNWMQSLAQGPQNEPMGYYLRAWARSEAAELNRCKYVKKSAP
jgi:hypothetical protein